MKIMVEYGKFWKQKIEIKENKDREETIKNKINDIEEKIETIIFFIKRNDYCERTCTVLWNGIFWNRGNIA